MPNRTLRDTIKKSHKLNAVSDAAQALWFRLLTCVDDYGRFDADPVLVASACYPMRLHANVSKISAQVKELSDIELIVLYTVKADKYLYFTNWDAGNIRAKKSKFPEPCNHVQAIASKCLQTLTNVPDTDTETYNGNVLTDAETETGVQGENPPTPHSLEKPKRQPKDDDPPGFGAWYEIYPKHVAHQAAIKAWNKLKPDETLIKTMCAAIQAQRKAHDALLLAGQFAPEYPHPATWLNGKRWMDEITQPKPPETLNRLPDMRTIKHEN